MVVGSVCRQFRVESMGCRTLEPAVHVFVFSHLGRYCKVRDRACRYIDGGKYFVKNEPHLLVHDKKTYFFLIETYKKVTLSYTHDTYHS